MIGSRVGFLSVFADSGRVLRLSKYGIGASRVGNLRYLKLSSLCTALLFSWTTLIPVIPTEAEAQPRPGDNRTRIYRFDMVQGPDVSEMMALRIEEFYKAILDVNSQLHVLQEEDLIIGIVAVKASY